MFTAQEYVDWLRLQAVLKRPYWFGTFGQKCTESLLQSKRKQYPSHYGSGRLARYRGHIAAGQICADCVGGAIKWAVWSDLGRKENVYASGGCPDTTADGMFRLCKERGMDWGSIGNLPDEPGVALRSAGHVGVYIGGGKAVEWRGFNYGCVITEVKQRPWTHWYRLPWVEYGAATQVQEAMLGSRLLRKGMRGEDVRQLQQLLEEFGFAPGDADGIYGAQTKAAVVRMQQSAMIEADGIYGEISHAALMEMQSSAAPEEDVPAAGYPVRVTGGTVNIRSGAGTQYRIVTVVEKGAVLQAVSRAENGWYAVEVGAETGWISGRYAETIA